MSSNPVSTSNISRPEAMVSDAGEKDFPDIQRIYASYVLHSTASLEEIPPSVDEMKMRWRNAQEKSLPYIVAKIDGAVVGYAYASAYRARSGYRFTVEESVYVADEFRGAGIGQALLNTLITRCREKNYTQMIAVIAGTDNSASIKFHEAIGFTQAGILHKAGFKFGKWLDTVLMQKAL